MSNVSIEVFNIARTQVDREAVRRWLDHLGATEFEIPEDGGISDPALLIALAAKRCYMAFQVDLNKNLSRVRTDMVEYIDNILASGHGSVLEHSVYTFAIEGVSRVFTGELNRHRAGWAISEGSMRFIRFEKDIPWWMPKSISFNEADDLDLHMRKVRSQGVFMRAFRQMQENYAELIDIWEMDAAHHNFTYKKKVTSCLRRIVGMGCATGGVWSGNIRGLRHVLTMRAADVAEEEIFHVFAEKIAPIMLAQEPLLFGDFKQTETGAWEPGYRKV